MRQILRRKASGIAVQAALQISHKQSRRNAFAGDVRQHKSHAAGSHVEKIVIVSANDARLNAAAGIVERLQMRLLSGKKLALHGAGDSDFLQQRFVVGPLGKVEVPDVALRIEAFDAALAFGGSALHADPDDGEQSAALRARNFENFSKPEPFPHSKQAGTVRGDVDGVGRPGLFAQSRAADLHAQSHADALLPPLVLL